VLVHTQLWVERNFDLKALSRKGVCWQGHNLLHTVVGPRAAAAMARHNLSTLLVLTHPHLQPVITEMLAEVGGWVGTAVSCNAVHVVVSGWIIQLGDDVLVGSNVLHLIRPYAH
jgi:hypothetical protein